jgi:hypothetical protein
LEGTKCVVIDAQLEEDDVMLFEFLLEFAKDNQLQVERLDKLPES